MTPATTPLAARVRLEAMLHVWKRLVRLESAALGEGGCAWESEGMHEMGMNRPDLDPPPAYARAWAALAIAVATVWLILALAGVR